MLPCGVVPLYLSTLQIFTARGKPETPPKRGSGGALGAVGQDLESRSSLLDSEDLDLVGFRVGFLIG